MMTLFKVDLETGGIVLLQLFVLVFKVARKF